METLLQEINYDYSFRFWAKDKTIEEIVENCSGSIFLSLSVKLNLPTSLIKLAKSRCAKTIIHLVDDQRFIDIIDMAEKVGLNQYTEDEFNTFVSSLDLPNSKAKAKDIASYYALASCASVFVFEDTDLKEAHKVSEYASLAAGYENTYYYNYNKYNNEQKTAMICKEILGNSIISEINTLYK